MSVNENQHKWHFFRSGGFDQVALERGADLEHLNELDPKLWTVLNCPTTGLEFDSRTLALLDTDGDGQVRIPEVQSAVHWCCQRLQDADLMFQNPGVPLSAINDQDEEGQALKTAAQRVLQYSGKTAQDTLQTEDFADKAKLFSADHFNGDGVVMAELTDDDELKQFISDIVTVTGGVADRSGGQGVDESLLAAFMSDAKAIVDWYQAAEDGSTELNPLGSATADAVAAFEQVQAKIDDFFVRCQLAAFDSRATPALNPEAGVYAVLANRAVASADTDIAALPLAEVGPERPLPLGSGVNPAWAAAIAQFSTKVVQPLLGKDTDSLQQADWVAISAQLAGWRAWQASKLDSALHNLPTERLQQIINSDLALRLEALIAADKAEKTFADNVDNAERLVHYQRYLVTLLRNFVSLSDFYQGKKKAIFQAGTLYLDQRSCELVMFVNDMARHATMAPFSGCYLVYCTCVRKGEAPVSIVAALTGGDVDELMVPGRNGVFYDRQGRDWKASVTKVVAQPVSIRQAFWSPYKRVAAFIETQLQKFAASRDKDIETKTTADIAAAPAAGASSFDIAKFAGIFAAIGLAVGALGTALAAIVSGLFALPWWQVPLVLLGVVLLISCPSMLMAYMTLRRRNLGPLLDANGWAVNTRARINVPFGASLTGLATLPKGAKRTMTDPFAEKKRPWGLIMLLLLLTGAAVWFWLYR
ncbi:hypothetical protein [Rheinheimera fenheensis]|uniref:hypothetical protein n=1 Tax=Rheinheimera fenheensis TaxID=3152295 RepID=UPI00325CFD07